jgi:hypothetical protein
MIKMNFPDFMHSNDFDVDKAFKFFKDTFPYFPLKQYNSNYKEVESFENEDKLRKSWQELFVKLEKFADTLEPETRFLWLKKVDELKSCAISPWQWEAPKQNTPQPKNNFNKK